MKEKLKEVFKNKYHVINISILLILFILFSIFKYDSFSRIFYSIIFLFEGLIYYFANIFLIKLDVPTSLYSYSLVNYPSIIIPTDLNLFWESFKNYFFATFNLERLTNIFSNLTNVLTFTQIFISLILTLVIIFVCVFNLYSSNKNPQILGKRKGLSSYENFRDTKLKKVKVVVNNYLEFNRKHKFYYYILLILFAFFLNVIALIIETVSYVFILFGNLLSLPAVLYYFLYTTLGVIERIFALLPLFIWLIIFIILFALLRRYLAKKKIYALMKENEEFCTTKLGVATLVTGVMESGKDSFCSQATITMQRVFKEKLLEVMSYYKGLFKDFDFITYEKYIEQAKNEKWIDVSLQIKSCLLAMKEYESKNEKEKVELEKKKIHLPEDFYNYDRIVFNGSEPITKFELLSDYGQAYFLYNRETPNVYSNIGMRIGYDIENQEYFPSFNYDPFKEKDYETYKRRTHYSINWNFDTWRLGIRFNNNSGISDCGIYNCSELGKERGNRLTNAGKDKQSQQANQNNDDFNKFVKLLRHVYTIHYFPFIKFISNDQRISSINCDLNELFETIVTLKKNKKVKNTLFLYNAVEKPILDVLIDVFNNILKSYRNTRNYTSLSFAFINNIYNKLSLFKAKTENYFNFRKFEMNVSQSGIEVNSSSDFYLIFKEAYSGAFATDCYFRFFTPLIEKKDGRIYKEIQFNNKYASNEEFNAQNSLLVKDIEECKAFYPPLSNEEYKAKFNDAFKTALKSYPAMTLKSIYKDLDKVYGKQLKGYSYWLQYIKANDLVKIENKRKKKKEKSKE